MNIFFKGMLEDTPRQRPVHRDDMALVDPFGGFGGGFFGGIMRQMVCFDDIFHYSYILRLSVPYRLAPIFAAL